MATTIQTLTSPFRRGHDRSARAVTSGVSMVWVVNHDSPKNATVTRTTRTAATVSRGSESPPETMRNSLRKMPKGGMAERPRTASHQHGPAPGQGADPAADLGHVLGGELAHDRAGPEERRAFGRGVGQDVEQHPDDGDGRAEAHPDGQDPHVLDARIGQQALQVALAQQVEGGEQQRGQPEDQQHVAGEGRPERAHGDLEVAQDGVEADRQQRPRQQRRDRGGGLGVCVGQPGMHRDQTHLGPEAEHGQHEGQANDVRREPMGAPASSLP